MVNRGDVWWVDFGAPQGSEPGYVRPAIVISSDRFNVARVGTVVVCPLTSNLKRAGVPGHVEYEAGVAGLNKPSLALAWKPMTIDRKQLIEPIGALGFAQMNPLNDELRLVLDL